MKLNKQYYFIVLYFIGLLAVCQSSIAAVNNYTEAKHTARKIWQEHRETFYCGCTYNRHGIIDFSSCDFKPKNSRGARYITWEHVVPVSWYGRSLSCWRGEGCAKGKRGRQCCRQKDKKFRQMEADLHNLVPAVDDLNKARKNYRFTDEMVRPSQQFLECGMLIDDEYKQVVPPTHHKGMIARIHLYMSKKYDIPLSKDERKQFLAWHKRYPPSEWEKKWDQKVAAEQGNRNEFIR
ncbi:MAG TPA: endonuclease [Candidatus Berkiella sp.]|nr:endonuclease [Candidatus Berkiella sp.]